MPYVVFREMLLYVQKIAVPFKEANWEVVAVSILHHRKERLREFSEPKIHQLHPCLPLQCRLLLKVTSGQSPYF
jgi:hypothetical protein